MVDKHIIRNVSLCFFPSKKTYAISYETQKMTLINNARNIKGSKLRPDKNTCSFWLFFFLFFFLPSWDFEPKGFLWRTSRTKMIRKKRRSVFEGIHPFRSGRRLRLNDGHYIPISRKLRVVDQSLKGGPQQQAIVSVPILWVMSTSGA